MSISSESHIIATQSLGKLIHLGNLYSQPAPQQKRLPKRLETPLRLQLLVTSTLNKATEKLSTLTVNPTVPKLASLCQLALKRLYPNLTVIEIEKSDNNLNLSLAFKGSAPLRLQGQTHYNLDFTKVVKLDPNALGLIGGFCKSIQWLNLSGLPLDDKALNSFPLETVECLSLADSGVNNSALALLARRAKFLTYLDLSRTPASSQGLVHLGALENLRDLRLTGCANITDKGLWSFIKANPHVLNVVVKHCPSLHPAVATRKKAQEDLVIDLKEAMQPETLALLFTFQSKIRNLILQNCHDLERLNLVFDVLNEASNTSVDSIIFRQFTIPDEQIAKLLVAKRATLTKLCVIGPLTAAAIDTLTSRLKKLCCLVLQSTGTRQLQDADFLQMSHNCEELVEIGFVSLLQITRNGLEHLLNNCKKLQKLFLSSCPLISDSDLKELKQKYPTIRIDS